ncbi:MAG: hypothetical protein ACOYS2_00020 [Patescibacteria group bacterium]
MVDEIKSNLEPIEPSDLNLEDKFQGGDESVSPSSPEEASKLPSSQEDVPEAVPEVAPEKFSEKKEDAGEKESFYRKILSGAKKSANSDDSADEVTDDDLEVVKKEKEVENKIQALLGIVEARGVVYAVKVAKKLEDNYVLDELHDRMLSEKFHAALVAKGFIKDI